VFLLEYSAASDALTASIADAIQHLEQSSGQAVAGGKSATTAADPVDDSIAHSDELDADHDNLAFVGRQLEAMAAKLEATDGVGPQAAATAAVRLQVEQQGGRSVAALLEKMFIKELSATGGEV
jgi:hypothetical protein